VAALKCRGPPRLQFGGKSRDTPTRHAGQRGRLGQRRGEVGPCPRASAEELMRVDHTYSVTEIVGSSPDSIDQAIRNAISRANSTVRHLDWFEVVQIRGHIVDGEIGHFQVAMKVGFRLEDGS
jgi:flavin-binding protein dodecin